MSSYTPGSLQRVAKTGIACVSLLPVLAVADGLVVDRIYEPYVQPLENEFEWRSIMQWDDGLGGPQKHSFGIGRGWSERWATEVYVIGSRTNNESIAINAFELEARWQLTEQGEYAFDWGMVFELERETETVTNGWEMSATLVSAREIGRWTGIANISLIYEWGSQVNNEFETALRMQARYRFKESFEPAVELHMGQGTVALGPAVGGLVRLSPGKKLRWQAGVFLGLDERSPNQTVELRFEYEY
ncbi:MAG: hypothetical protein GWP02_05005 [Desulfobulbaceae bacterium]|nr:hypothetical protein [Desulfobulbaceae bacterium]